MTDMLEDGAVPGGHNDNNDDDNNNNDALDANELVTDAELDDNEREQRNAELLKPLYPAIKPIEMQTAKQFRRVPVPEHRRSPLQREWEKIYTPIVQFLNLQIRYNTKIHAVELKNSSFTEDSGALQKAVDFIKAFVLGFDVEDALALLRLDDLYIDSFQVEDVRYLHGDHLSRAIGRVSGKDGRAKFTIENVTRTRIVIADRRIHILGAFNNIKLARDAICDLIIGSPINKIYARMQSLSGRINSF